ncbi:MAG: M20/M25/M40 family metallo-hydrolase [Lachnospiraceae bacterium]|nr:M20/M25/M40 family metallo-hydrolase [Lachnospiraceae bacterium]
MVALYIILGIVFVLAVVVISRTIAFKPKEDTACEVSAEVFDKEKAVNNLQQLVKCKTVSNVDSSLEDDAEFEKLIDLLPKLYPNVFKVCSFEKLPDRGLLFCFKGSKRTGKPSVLMAHYDVVPVNEDQWTKPAFDGLIENGIMWGRGTLDTKVTFNGVLTAADELIAKGFTPENDIYFAFSGGEEINGAGAINIVDYFEKNGIELEMVVDEGGAVVRDVFPGVKEKCGLVGIAEKGMLNIEYTVKSAGGHASAPKPNSPIVVLSEAVRRVEKNPLKYHITKPVAEMFDTLGRRSSFVYRMIFANLWLFSGVLNMLCKKTGGEMNALLRTTVAFTTIQGSKAFNVIPPEAKMVTNIRINPDENMDVVLNHLKKTIDNDRVELNVINGFNPSPISRTDCEGWDRVKKAVEDTWKGCVVSPYLMVQCSDSRHYGRISDRVYRFSATEMTSEERGTIHGNDEHIRLEEIANATEFYIRLIKQC